MDHLTFHDLSALLKELKIRKHIEKEDIDEAYYQELQLEFSKRLVALEALPIREVVSHAEYTNCGTQVRSDIKIERIE